MAAGFQHVDETDQVGIHVGAGILDGVANSGLRRQIDHPLRLVVDEGVGQQRLIFQTGAHLGKAGIDL